MHFDYLPVLQHIFLYEHQKLLLLNLMRVQKFNDTEKNYCQAKVQNVEVNFIEIY